MKQSRRSYCNNVTLNTGIKQEIWFETAGISWSKDIDHKVGKTHPYSVFEVWLRPEGCEGCSVVHIA